jgi:hypothetical protein
VVIVDGTGNVDGISVKINVSSGAVITLGGVIGAIVGVKTNEETGVEMTLGGVIGAYVGVKTNCVGGEIGLLVGTVDGTGVTTLGVLWHFSDSVSV